MESAFSFFSPWPCLSPETAGDGCMSRDNEYASSFAIACNDKSLFFFFHICFVVWCLFGHTTSQFCSVLSKSKKSLRPLVYSLVSVSAIFQMRHAPSSSVVFFLSFLFFFGWTYSCVSWLQRPLLFLKVFGDNVPFSNALYLLEKRKHAVKSLRDVVVLTFLFMSLDNNSLCLAVVTVPFIVRIFSFICTISFPLFSVSLFIVSQCILR